MAEQTLIKFFHGLGDVVQFTVVLQHLQRYRPHWQVDVLTTQGKHSALLGLCHRVWIDGVDSHLLNEQSYQRHFDVWWYENFNGYEDRPNSKITNSLAEEFGIDYDPALARYAVAYDAAQYLRARAWLQAKTRAVVRPHGALNVVLFHYEGNTSPWKKNLDHDLVRTLCHRCLRFGLVPVILDWDNRSPLPDGVRIFNPGVSADDLWGNFGSGDAAMLAALIANAALFVGIDSGPGKVASATNTPSIIVWTGHHPIQFHDPSPSTWHLVPQERLAPATNDKIQQYFVNHYNHVEYTHLATTLAREMGRLLGIPQFWDDMAGHTTAELSANKFDQRYYEEHKAKGLDYASFGDWQKQYGRWLVDALQWHGKSGLDVGCACGAIVKGLRDAGADARGIDINNHMIDIGRRRWPELAIDVCDAVNLHLYDSESLDFYHSNQVAEHWREDYVPLIMREAARVLKQGGIYFWVADTPELFARQQRSAELEDPTNACVRSLTWWRDQAARAGLVRAPHWEDALRHAPGSFLARYDWDWFVAVKQ